MFLFFLGLLAKPLRRSLIVGFGFEFGCGLGFRFQFGFGLGFGFEFGLEIGFGFGLGFGRGFEFGLVFELTELPLPISKEQFVFTQIPLSDLSPHAHLLILSS